jgi:hypothetical protein
MTRPRVNRSLMGRSARMIRAKTACGVVAAPVFISAFTAIGAKRAGYDWRRDPVSSLAIGPGGWPQRVNFMVVGALVCVASRGLAQSERRTVGPSVVPALVLGVGVGLIGSGVFVTDPVAGFRPSKLAPDGPPPTPEVTREGMLHNFCAIPIFAGIPAAALTCAGSAVRRREYRWATDSAGSAIGMISSFVLFGAALGGRPRLARCGGIFQRISIATGFAWLSALSLRASRQAPHR